MFDFGKDDGEDDAPNNAQRTDAEDGDVFKDIFGSADTRYACCSVLQCVAVCCCVLQCVAVCCGVLQCAAVCCSVLQREAA